MSARWGQLVPYALRQWPRIGALLGLAVLSLAVEVLLPWPIKLAIDNALAGAPLPSAAEWLQQLAGARHAAGLIAWLALAVLLIFLAGQLLQLARGLLEAKLTTTLRITLGAAMFDRLHELALPYHRRASRGDVVRRLTTDTDCLPALVTGIFLPVVVSTLSLVVLFAIMWRLDAVLALVAVFVTVPMGLLMWQLAGRMEARAYEHQEAEGQVWSVAEQALSALPVVQAFGREAHEKSRFRRVADHSIRTFMHRLRTEMQFKVGVASCEAAGIAAVMLLGGLQVLAGSLSVGTLVVFLSYLTALYAPLVTFAYLTPSLAAATGSARRVVEVLEAPDVIRSSSGAHRLRVRAAHVTLNDITFGYEPGKAVLHSVDFEAHAGEVVALLGRTGAGKSTLVSLIPRLVDPWQGSVRIDGQDVRAASVESVRASVAVVLQDPFLLPISIAANIAYSRPAASAAQIEAAARAANAHEFIERLERGYETVIGERGATLSAGERQRVAIARALLKDAPILILDEPTSALDAESEHLIVDALRRLVAGRTTIIIAHRLTTVSRAHRIVVLDDGNVAAEGTHEALLASSPLYRTLYSAQASPGAPLKQRAYSS
jgi:ATP-binding cassette subfamily B protein/subfamily B ATP-binding cassette protein MsbA